MEEMLQPRSHLCIWKHREHVLEVNHGPYPAHQHRPICVSAHPVKVPQTIPFRRRFKFKKAWNGYSAELNKLIEDVELSPTNCKCFVESLRVTSRRHIPRGCRTEYVHDLPDDSEYIIKHTSTNIQAAPLTTVP